MIIGAFSIFGGFSEVRIWRICGGGGYIGSPDRRPGGPGPLTQGGLGPLTQGGQGPLTQGGQGPQEDQILLIPGRIQKILQFKIDHYTLFSLIFKDYKDEFSFCWLWTVDIVLSGFSKAELLYK